MLKVLHTGDWHIGSFPGPEVGGQNARFQDICRCLDFQAMYAEEHRPDLIVVSGDIFHQARVWSDRGLRESRTAIDHIRRLSNVAPTVVLRGTPNHDSEEQFEMLTTAFYGDDSVSVVTEPEVIHIHTYHGQRVDVACIPGFDRGVHRAAHPGLSREEETQVFTDELAKVVLGLKAQCEPGVTSILSTHFTVPGCNMESGQTALFAQFEPVIYPDTLKAADFDLVALGHIHRPQQLPEAGRAVFYCGSITGLNFNDEGQPRGFYIHDIDDDGEAWSEYIETPYREFETIRLNEDDVCTMLSAERVVVPDRLKGKIVRVLYTCSDETNKAFNKAVLEKRLYDGGVFYVSEITPEEITTSVNRDELHGDNSPEQNLAEYLAEKEKSPEDAQRIIELARPIISEAMEKGRLETPTGLFMPVEIEVKNYRNYRDELFSYDGISFATINGENGAGKSSLFMDAMLDALFEEPREGDLTGWICNDPDARSGSIKFTFYLGTKLYRVTRTRTKSGKATLNLSEYVDESWQNRSAEKYRDTQAIIENTIGMDSLTLKAEEYAVYRQAAATAKYRIKYDGELPELGTRFFCSGQYFVLAQDDALGIYIEAEKAGTEANDIPAGTSVVPTDTQRSLTACSIVEELEPGADDEDDESLRKRVQEKIAGPAENGNQQHYKTWCESISGVGRARIVPLWAGENTVKGILIDTEGGPASEAVVQRVQEYIDPGGTGLGEGQANIGAHFTATSATAKRVNISFSVTLAKGGDLASVRSAAQTALKAQIKSINLTTDDSETPTLRISTVGNTIYSLLGVLDYANLRFNGQTANVEAGKEEVFVLGEVTVSETNPVS